MGKKYDVVIVGAGAAAYTAALYTARYKLSAVAVGTVLGGTTTEAYSVENYPGFEEISGTELMDKFKKHAEKFGAEVVPGEVVDSKKTKDGFLVKTRDGKEYEGETLILAFGQKRRKLNVKGEKEFSGKGVSYCATCDGFFFKDKVVAVVGGSDAATMGSVFLAGLAKKVYIIYRGEKLRGEQTWIDRAVNNEKTEVIYNANITEFYGEQTLKGIKLDTGQNLELDGVFIEIGAEPDVNLIKKFGVKTDKRGYINVNSAQETNIKGIYAAGDNTNGSNHFEQIITAGAEGAVAAESINKYLKSR